MSFAVKFKSTLNVDVGKRNAEKIFILVSAQSGAVDRSISFERDFGMTWKRFNKPKLFVAKTIKMGITLDRCGLIEEIFTSSAIGSNIDMFRD